MTNNSALTSQSPPSHLVLSRPYHFCYPNFQNSIPISKSLSRLWALAPKVLHLRHGCPKDSKDSKDSKDLKDPKDSKDPEDLEMESGFSAE